MCSSHPSIHASGLVSALNPITIENIIETEEVCGLANGTLTIIASGGTQDLLYSIDGGSSYQSSNFFDGLRSGDYLCFISDGNSCSQPFSVQITSAEVHTLDFEFNCIDGQNTVWIDLFVFPSGVYTFDWTDPDGLSLNTEDLDEAKPGEYSITVTDKLGCFRDTSFIVPICCDLAIKCSADTTYYNCLNSVPQIELNLTNNDPDNGDDYASLLNMNVEVTDPCSDIIAKAYDQLNSPVDCSDQLEITRYFEITDGTNTYFCQQVYIIDNYGSIEITKAAEGPVFSCSDEWSSEFENWISNFGGIEFETCSSNYTLSTFPDIPSLNFNCEGNGNTEVEFIVEDECGNSISHFGYFEIYDDEAPIILCPEIITISNEDFLSDGIPSLWSESLISYDNCSAVITEFTAEEITVDATCEDYDLEVLFNSSDDCGNQSSCTSTIVITSQGLPTIVCPQPIEINCNGIDEFDIISWTSQANALFADGSELIVSNSFVFNELQNLSCGESLDVLFFTQDVCQQTVDCYSSVRIIDLFPPEIICPSFITIDIDDINAQSNINAWLSEVESSDLCSTVRLENNYSPDFSLVDCELTDVVEFLSFDQCDNFSSCFSEITFTKIHPLEIICPDPVTISLNDKGLENKINSLIENTTILSDLDFGITTDFNINLIDFDNQEIDSVEISIIVEDYCGNQNQCNSKVILIPSPRVYIPNVFSPDGDNFNDTFTVYSNAAVKEVTSMVIYNRWGEKIHEKYNFQSNLNQEGWDGFFENSKEKNNVFVYYITVKDLFDNELEFAGSIQLLR